MRKPNIAWAFNLFYCLKNTGMFCTWYGTYSARCLSTLWASALLPGGTWGCWRSSRTACSRRRSHSQTADPSSGGEWNKHQTAGPSSGGEWNKHQTTDPTSKHFFFTFKDAIIIVIFQENNTIQRIGTIFLHLLSIHNTKLS